MYDKEELVRNIEEEYTTKIFRAFGNIDPASKAIGIMATTLNDIYRYFEPNFFKGHFYVCKNLKDEVCFEEARGTLLYDKSILLNRTDGLMIIQVFNDKSKMILWEDQDPELLFKQNDTLTYHFNNNKEYFFANQQKIDVTKKNIGSRYATQFSDLQDALLHYSQVKVLKSSCKHFIQSWGEDKNRLFFRGGGSGKNIPEKFMQLSLHEYLSSYPFQSRGISMEFSREHNNLGNFTHPKPVDVKLVWREANRMVLIEVKFIGTVKKDSDGKIYSRLDGVSKGIADIKEYHDAAVADSPTTLLKSYLLVIDGRRNNLSQGQTTISVADGMHFKDIDLVIDDKEKFHETIQGFEKPIRMFAEPVCI